MQLDNLCKSSRAFSFLMDLVTYPRLPLSTKIFNFTEYIPRTWWETIRSVFKFNYWFKLSLNPRASSASLLQEWKRETERSICGCGTTKMHFQHCLVSRNIASARSFSWNPMTVVSYATPPTINNSPPWLLKYTSAPQRGTLLLLSCYAQQSQGRRRRATF